mmetsp:Transcript_32551/g.29402  ORF Transcript_32551/g.29402 Transcript_32551/m.29402 type:complete len:121 (-) Transcript_32551:456-818(-)
MDIKLENMLLGEDFQLKIIDFEFFMGLKLKPPCPGKGSVNYRAPELKNDTIEDFASADIYSAGIVLFAMRVGLLPYLEDESINGQYLEDLLHKNPNEFWESHKFITPKNVTFSQSFVELF